MNKKVFIVAEIGCNHNGSKEIAKRMVDEAKRCGVDAVKFQVFSARELISRFAPKAEYQIKTTGNVESQLEMTEKLELTHADYIELKAYAEKKGLDVFATPFDLGSVEFLHKLGQKTWKIPSGEITNLPYLKRIGGIQCDNKKVIISTGMSTIEEISCCIDILIQSGTQKKEIILLHCNTEYPTPDDDVELLAISEMKKFFSDFQIGFSDHSIGYTAAIGATVLDICMIEKHFTLDKNMEGPDHKASVNPEELEMLVKSVRRMERMLGSGKKTVTASERENKIVARKSIVAKRAILKGEVFTIENITCKRPGNGISPMKWYDVLGRQAERDFYEDELIVCKGFSFQE